MPLERRGIVDFGKLTLGHVTKLNLTMDSILKHSILKNEPLYDIWQIQCHGLKPDESEAFWSKRFFDHKCAFIDSEILAASPENYKSMIAAATEQILVLTADEPFLPCGFFKNYKAVDSMVQSVIGLCRANCLVELGQTGQDILHRAFAIYV